MNKQKQRLAEAILLIGQPAYKNLIAAARSGIRVGKLLNSLSGHLGQFMNKRPEAEAISKPKKPKKRQRPNYQKYIKSKEWQRVRYLALARYGALCSECRTSDGLQIHHRTYAHLGDEANHLEDLQVLCGRCHDKEHKAKELLNEDPAKKWARMAA